MVCLSAVKNEKYKKYISPLHIFTDLEVKIMNEIPYNERFTLSIKEAASYFHIGIKKMRLLAENNLGVFAVISGNRYLIIRTKFEEYLCNNSTV